MSNEDKEGKYVLRCKSVQPLDNYKLLLIFENDEQRIF